MCVYRDTYEDIRTEGSVVKDVGANEITQG